MGNGTFRVKHSKQNVSPINGSRLCRACKTTKKLYDFFFVYNYFRTSLLPDLETKARPRTIVEILDGVVSVCVCFCTTRLIHLKDRWKKEQE